jgi:hypothetical protein
MLTTLSEAKPARNVWLRWPAFLKIRRGTSAPSQGVNDDIELGPTSSQDASSIPSPDGRMPVNIGHIHWALENSIRHETGSTPYQQQLTRYRASRHDLAHLSVSHRDGRVIAANDRCSEPHSANGSHRAIGSSGESGEEALRARDDYGATLLIGESPKVLTGEVEGNLGRCPSVSSFRTEQHVEMLPWLSKEVTIGRNSNFHGLSAKDREELGGIEYRSLKILLKILIGKSSVNCYSWHVAFSDLLGRALSRPAYNRRHRSFAVDNTWTFALPRVLGIPRAGQSVVVSAPSYNPAELLLTEMQGFLLRSDHGDKSWFHSHPRFNGRDSMPYMIPIAVSNMFSSQVSFRDATWPMILMTFLALAGYNFHPILLRGIIWTAHKVGPVHTRDSLEFLLDHPRRCYTLLFPNNVTWVLFGILVILNVVDVLLIILLDLDNEEVRSLSPGPRVLAAAFQAASARHTGTSTFDLADVNPAVQFSLVTMMYITVFPIVMIVRSSNTYEERILGIYQQDSEPDDTQGPLAYLTRHARNQLGFDLWYIFLGAFCICVAESGKIVDRTDLAFSEFAILFECTSAYGNVGLSLGTNETNTSLSGDFSLFSKLIICAMMWRGRHRGLPYDLDYAVMLPSDSAAKSDSDDRELESPVRSLTRNGSIQKRSKTA